MQHHTTPSAAAYLGLSPKTLENWRITGRGPAYVKIGARVLYPQHELDAFVARNTHRPEAVQP